MKSLTASDRSALIRLAASLPVGDANRRAILAGLLMVSDTSGGQTAGSRIASSFDPGDKVLYKGKPYILRWSGPTRFGDRAKIQFLDGSKEFWVDASTIKSAPGGGSSFSPRGRGGRCRASGCSNPATLNAPHQRAMDGYCGYCAYDEI